MGNVLDFNVSKDRALRIHDIYAAQCESMQQAMQSDCETLERSGYIPDTNEHWEKVKTLEAELEKELESLRAEGKDLVAFKIKYALPLTSRSPSRFLKVLEVCGVQYDD